MEFIEECSYESPGAVALDGSGFYMHTALSPVVRDVRPAPQAPDLSEGFRETMRALASGVVLITTYVADRPWGVTVTSCCSLSVDPARILVSLMRTTATCQAIEAGCAFGVNVLGDAHKQLAQFGAARGAPKFLDLDSELGIRTPAQTLAPMVDGALAYLDCRLDRLFDGGDHSLIVGRVLNLVTANPRGSASPLLYFDGEFYHLGSPL